MIEEGGEEKMLFGGKSGKKKDWRQLSCGLMVLSSLSVLAAAWGFVYSDIVLASTQWLLVAAVLGVWGIYARMEG